jgi:hypothetical protein
VSLLGDNPTQSEEASHILKGLYLCRRCWVGGDKEHTESAQGFHELHTVSWYFADHAWCPVAEWKEPARSRTVQETRSEVEKQIEEAARGVASVVDQRQRESGVKDRVAQDWIKVMLDKARHLTKSGVPNIERLVLHGSTINQDWNGIRCSLFPVSIEV